MDNLEKELLEKIKSQVNDALEAKASEQSKSLELLKDQLDELKNADKSEAFKSELTNMAAELKALKEGAADGTVKSETFASGFVKGYESILKEIGVDGMRKKGFSQSIEVKAAGTMATSNIDAVGTSSIPYTLSDFALGLVRTQRRKPFIMDLCNVGSTNKMYVQWAEMANNDPGTAGMTSEGGAKTQEDFDVNEKSAKVEKVTAYTKVSLEMLDDVDFIRAEIENNLMELIALKADSQVLVGNGSTPNLNGIVTQATAYSAGSFAATIPSPSYFDVLQTAIAQVEIANYTPNYIVLNPADVSVMLLQKDSQVNYLKPALIQVADGGLSFGGIPVIKNNGVTAGSFLVGDFNQANVRIRKAATLSLGYENDDFTKNLITVLAEMRLVCYIPSNRVTAFSYGTFSTAITALELSA